MTPANPDALAESLRKSLAMAASDPGNVVRADGTKVGYKGDRSMGGWIADAIIAGPLAPLLASLQQVTGENENLRKHLESCALTAGHSPIASYPISTSIHRLRKQLDTATAEVASLRAEVEALKGDAERFRALMRCGRIKVQGSAGVDVDTGALKYPDHPGSVHFGAEFWPQREGEPDRITKWGQHCIRALADDILRVEAARAATAREGQADG